MGSPRSWTLISPPALCENSNRSKPILPKTTKRLQIGLYQEYYNRFIIHNFVIYRLPLSSTAFVYCRNCVRNNVGSIAPVVPGLFWNQPLGLPEYNGTCDHPLVVKFIKTVGGFRPLLTHPSWLWENPTSDSPCFSGGLPVSLKPNWILRWNTQ